MSETPAVAKPPLDEVMLAMDVVDTLRHRERVVERALSADAQDKELVARLKEIYAGQGIAVSDEILERGVKDLRENRFVYTPPAPGAGVTLARLYVSRGRWGKPLFLIVGVVAAVLIGYQLLVRGPAEARIAALPAELEQAYAAVVAESEAPAVETERTRRAATGSSRSSATTTALRARRSRRSTACTRRCCSNTSCTSCRGPASSAASGACRTRTRARRTTT
jgi:hypothetical protein